MNNILSYLRIPMFISSSIAAVLSGVLYFKQNELIYPRDIPSGCRANVPKPSQFGITDFEELMIPTPDGESLNAFLIRPSNKSHARKVTILMFHGNAGNIGYRLPIAKVLEEDLGCNVLMLQYRGYGLSTGTPNEKGLTIDAQTGLDYIRERAELCNTKIIIYGQSLGGAVSIGLVARNLEQKDIAGLILENTFLSMRKLIPSAFPPARFLAILCHQIWPSDEMISRITDVPILFLSGEQDEIVPAYHMKQLYNLSRTKRRIMRTFPNGTHNDTVAEPEYFQFIEDFINTYIANRAPTSYRRRMSKR
ncbi:BEM46 family protein-like protein [Pseudovirgaria hyperparasitica]|uniref:BEM46 family protein-like protein n=1 Tax=Pseudovirgaria hyperparasitica TaxID=470096 RepID=A0A6A6WE22_9PEZI|nr:BEM46 family protein-like protein [Pseudovirgaria hyperparasitica]KAF2759361.1 BEM46 family protein-like protein [Pseudovirgaria hyperparasitica]